MLNASRTAPVSYMDFVWSPIRLAYDTIPTLASITGWRYLSRHMFLQTTALIVLNYLIYNSKLETNKFISNVILDKYNSLSCESAGNETCAMNGPETWEKFENTFLPIVPIILGQIALVTIQSLISKYFQSTLTRKLVDCLNEKKFHPQVAYSMSFNKDQEFILHNIIKDSLSFSESSALITSAFSASQNALMVLNNLIKLSTFIPVYGPVAVPDLALCSLAYGITTNLITQWLGSYKIEWSSKISHLKMELRTIQAHDDKNIKTITERGGENYALSQQNNTIHEIRNLDNRLILLGELQTAWQSTHAYLYNIGRYYVFGWRLFTQSLLYEYRWTIHETMNEINPAFLWTEKNNDSVNNLKVVTERINLFLKEYDKVKAKIASDLIDQAPEERDKVKAIISTPLRRIKSSSSAVELKGFGISAGSMTLLEPSDYTFTMGKRYLITGQSGNGKSTILSKIKGLMDAGGITCEGKISTPSEKTIILLPQGDYFPHGKSLREAIYYPDPALKDENYINKAVELLVEMEFGSREAITKLLDNQNDLYTRLSGGQKKKVQIVSEIMKKPDVLMLDESLNGMNESSRAATLKILERELPESMILVVDHNGEKDLQFYNDHLLFAGHRLTNSPHREKSVSR